MVYNSESCIRRARVVTVDVCPAFDQPNVCVSYEQKITDVRMRVNFETRNSVSLSDIADNVYSYSRKVLSGDCKSASWKSSSVPGKNVYFNWGVSKGVPCETDTVVGFDIESEPSFSIESRKFSATPDVTRFEVSGVDLVKVRDAVRLAEFVCSGDR